MPATEVPDGWWQAACERVRHPIACVAPDNQFVWVNSAFERLVGYSLLELREKTWLDITVQSDIGGDLASVHAVVRGEIDQYSLTNHYRHRNGDLIAVELSVWRFPPGFGNMSCFIVDAAPEAASRVQLRELKEEMDRTIRELREDFERHRPNESQTINIGDNVGGDKTGRDKTTKTTNGLALIVTVLLAITTLLGYMAYVATWPHHHGNAEPPQVISE